MRKLLTILLTHVFITGGIYAQKTFPVNGLKDERHTRFAFINAKIFVDYKTVLDSATLIIKDGKIEDVGKGIAIPGDAVVFDLKGKNIYPSLIDLYSDYSIPEIKKERREQRGPQFISNTKGAYGWNQAIKPETNAVNMFAADEKKAEALRKIGFGAVLTHQKDGIARGTAAFVALADLNENETVIKDKAAAMYSFDKGSSTQDYPGSLMGCIALLRQTYLDGQWYAAAGKNAEYNISLDAWNKVQSLPQIFEAGDKLNVLRADRIGDEFAAKYIIKTSGNEYQRINEIKSTGDALIVPVNFPEAYDVSDPYDALNITLGEMKHWEMAPANAAALEKAGIDFAFTADGLKEKNNFLKNIKKAIDNGLTEQRALKACTQTPAELLGVADKVGSLKKGMIANFIITSKNLFDDKNVIFENWVMGRQYIIRNKDVKDMRGNYELSFDEKKFNIKVKGEISETKFILEEDTNKIEMNFTGDDRQLVLKFDLKKTKGTWRLNGFYDEQNKLLKGNGWSPDGKWINWKAKFISAYIPDVVKDTAKKEKPSAGELWFPNMGYGWKQLPVQKTVLIKNAAVWTNESEGTMQNTDVLILDGKIFRVGKNLDVKGIPDVQVIDGTGKHLTAGIIDEHSHIAISGDVNECTQSVTSEVRIGDVVDCDDISLYRQLAGGVTSSHLLHGSCNPVGGQTQLIKLRWGHSPEEMKFKNWDGFIKFALGENVKQSNWGDDQTIRYPQTRMGVEQVYVDAFTRAREYESAWKNYKLLNAKDKISKSPPRKDIELEALDEILKKKRFITCHSYEQSEINMLMHVADTFGFRVNTFTHILEGYKVADKMKKHGAGGSSFADWWAYKFEVYEAIPHNPAIMNKMGIVVAINSDDGEMARRLNQEAAKSVKYGGISEEEALKFVTLNPAKLLHVDDRVGSIKAGKDADVVLWTDNPLSIYAKVQQTYVDGICYYDADRDLVLRNEIAKERARLIQKMLDSKNKGEKTQVASQKYFEEKHCNPYENFKN